MRITVECYGVLEQVCGGRQSLELPDASASVAQALDALRVRAPAVAAYLPCTACAVGDELVGRGYRLREGETLVLLPPVSGGLGGASAGPDAAGACST